MTPSSPKKSIWNKHFPTVLGMGVLVVALVAGLILLGGNTNVFSPRATPQTTPKNIQLSNISDTSFSVSFTTDEMTPGFVKYGTSATDLKQQTSDDRDQLTGSIGSFTTHHITLRGLQPNTPYFYVIGTGSNSTFDNSGTAYSTATFARAGTPGAAQTAYGTILGAAGSPAVGAIVSATAPGVGTLSTIVKESGSWAIPLSNARTTEGKYADLALLSSMTLSVQAPDASPATTQIISLADSQPVPTITLGTGGTASATNGGTSAAEGSAGLGNGANIPADGFDPITLPTELDNESSPAGITSLPDQSLPTIPAGGLGAIADTTITGTPTGTASAQLGEVILSGVIDLAELEVASKSGSTAIPQITSSQPIIRGKAAALTRVTITVHSDTAIEQQLVTDANGNFTLDISLLQQTLEPGEHTATYSYTDPKTGQLVTKTQTFIVTGSAGQLAQAAATPVPFGSGNPYPIATPVSSASATTSAVATRSGTITYPATGSGIPVSGSTGTTMALIGGGLFFLSAGMWSYYLAQKATESIELDQ